MKTATLDKHAVSGKSTHPTELIQKIQKGLLFSERKILQAPLDLPFEKLAAKLCISRSTLQRRKAAGRLSPDESDKVVRFSRLLRQATTVFGDAERARAWLKHPQVGLGGAGPPDHTSTGESGREGQNLVGRSEEEVLTAVGPRG